MKKIRQCLYVILSVVWLPSVFANDSKESITTKEINDIFSSIVESVVKPTIERAMDEYSLPMYTMYFDVVSENVTTFHLHDNYRSVFNKIGLKADAITFGYSTYLASAVNKVAMTDCTTIYFPNADFVDRLKKGDTISEKQMLLLLHEMGHAQQCQSTTRETFARRWFREISPATINSIKAGTINSKIIHDAMPLEKEAELFAKKMYSLVIKN